MVYIKIFNDDGSVSLQEQENPVYVYVQPENGRILRCIPEKAQGIVNAEGTEIYQLSGKAPIPGAGALVQQITRGEYEELRNAIEQPESDPEDDSPAVSEEEPEMEILTRAELTRKVMELDEAVELILSGVTE